MTLSYKKTYVCSNYIVKSLSKLQHPKKHQVEWKSNCDNNKNVVLQFGTTASTFDTTTERMNNIEKVLKNDKQQQQQQQHEGMNCIEYKNQYLAYYRYYYPKVVLLEHKIQKRRLRLKSSYSKLHQLHVHIIFVVSKVLLLLLLLLCSISVCQAWEASLMDECFYTLLNNDIDGNNRMDENEEYTQVLNSLMKSIINSDSSGSLYSSSSSSSSLSSSSLPSSSSNYHYYDMSSSSGGLTSSLSSTNNNYNKQCVPKPFSFHEVIGKSSNNSSTNTNGSSSQSLSSSSSLDLSTHFHESYETMLCLCRHKPNRTDSDFDFKYYNSEVLDDTWLCCQNNPSTNYSTNTSTGQSSSNMSPQKVLLPWHARADSSNGNGTTSSSISTAVVITSDMNTELYYYGHHLCTILLHAVNVTLTTRACVESVPTPSPSSIANTDVTQNYQNNSPTSSTANSTSTSTGLAMQLLQQQEQQDMIDDSNNIANRTIANTTMAVIESANVTDFSPSLSPLNLDSTLNGGSESNNTNDLDHNTRNKTKKNNITVKDEDLMTNETTDTTRASTANTSTSTKSRPRNNYNNDFGTTDNDDWDEMSYNEPVMYVNWLALLLYCMCVISLLLCICDVRKRLRRRLQLQLQHEQYVDQRSRRRERNGKISLGYKSSHKGTRAQGHWTSLFKVKDINNEMNHSKRTDPTTTRGSITSCDDNSSSSSNACDRDVDRILHENSSVDLGNLHNIPSEVNLDRITLNQTEFKSQSFRKDNPTVMSTEYTSYDGGETNCSKETQVEQQQIQVQPTNSNTTIANSVTRMRDLLDMLGFPGVTQMESERVENEVDSCDLNNIHSPEIKVAEETIFKRTTVEDIEKQPVVSDENDDDSYNSKDEVCIVRIVNTATPSSLPSSVEAMPYSSKSTNSMSGTDKGPSIVTTTTTTNPSLQGNIRHSSYTNNINHNVQRTTPSVTIHRFHATTEKCANTKNRFGKFNDIDGWKDLKDDQEHDYRRNRQLPTNGGRGGTGMYDGYEDDKTLSGGSLFGAEDHEDAATIYSTGSTRTFNSIGIYANSINKGKLPHEDEARLRMKLKAGTRDMNWSKKFLTFFKEKKCKDVEKSSVLSSTTLMPSNFNMAAGPNITSSTDEVVWNSLSQSHREEAWLEIMETSQWYQSSDDYYSDNSNTNSTKNKTGEHTTHRWHSNSTDDIHDMTPPLMSNERHYANQHTIPSCTRFGKTGKDCFPSSSSSTLWTNIPLDDPPMQSSTNIRGVSIKSSSSSHSANTGSSTTSSVPLDCYHRNQCDSIYNSPVNPKELSLSLSRDRRYDSQWLFSSPPLSASLTTSNQITTTTITPSILSSSSSSNFRMQHTSSIQTRTTATTAELKRKNNKHTSFFT